MADKYFLLRSNKQSGPYTSKELEQMRLQPYDLVWVEGKSAAWRFPGEVEELKSFAPLVEEQPYDRFFKSKSGANEQSNGQNKRIDVGNENPRSEHTSDEKRVTVILPEANPDLPATEKPLTTKEDNILTNQQSIHENKLYSTKPGNLKTNPIEDEHPEIKFRKSLSEAKSNYRAPDTRQHPKSLSWNKQSGWMVAVVGLVLLLGILIGIYWNKFPANEVFVATATADDSIIKKENLVDPKTNSAELSTKENKEEPAEKPAEEPAINTADILNSEGPIEDISENRLSITEQPPKEIFRFETKEMAETEKVRKTEPLVPNPQRPLINRSIAMVEKSTKKNDVATIQKERAGQNNHANRSGVRIDEKSSGKSLAPILKPNAKSDPCDDAALVRENSKPIEQLIDVNGIYTHRKGRIGINPVELTLYNRSNGGLGMVSVEVQYLGVNKELLKKETLNFRNIPAHGAIQIKATGSEKGESVGYKVLYITSGEGSLYYACN